MILLVFATQVGEIIGISYHTQLSIVKVEAKTQKLVSPKSSSPRSGHAEVTSVPLSMTFLFLEYMGNICSLCCHSP
jgi:hypothetical protein